MFIFNKNNFHKLRTSLLRFLYKLINIFESDSSSNHFHFLTPNNKAENIDEYSRALKSALDEQGINNIAITGPYGSGKSSFINTFMFRNSQYKTIFISLATFNHAEQKPKGPSEDAQTIEKRLLKQLFYQASPSKIPLSKFKRINERGFLYSLSSLILMPFSIMYSFLYGLWFFKSSLFINYIDMFHVLSTNGILSSNKLNYVLLGLFLLCSINIYQKLRLYYKGKNLKKIDYKSLEFESKVDDESSVFDRNLDEILYFFDSHDFDVVIIEDLDRNNDIDIFTKFRELNNLINSYNKRKNDIRFVYLVGDKLFDKNTRVKFFDFIVPIIPYINPDNSYEKFLKIFGDDIEVDKLQKSLLRNVSNVIDDFRLLTNIYNEYLVYRPNVFNDIDKNKLLAMIVYKNIHPQEFRVLHKSDNDDKVSLKAIFYKKDSHIDTLKSEIKSSLKILKKKYDAIKMRINQEIASDVEQLKLLYLCEMNNYINPQTNINFNGQIYNANNFGGLLSSVESNFSSLESNGFHTTHIHGGRHTHITFNDLEKNVNRDITYLERKELIENGPLSLLGALEAEIESKENQSKDIKNKSIKQLLKLPGAEEIIFKNITCDLTKYLVRNGFIDEDYNLSISYFFEGSISPEGVKFSLDVDSLIEIPPDTRIPNAKGLLYNLEDRIFSLPNILNHDITNSLIEHKNDNELESKYNIFLELLCNGSDRSNEFAFSKEFFDNLILILSDVVDTWPNLWTDFIKTSQGQFKIDKLLSAIINSLELDDILKLNKGNVLRKRLNTILSLNIFNPENNAHNMQVIKMLDLGFANLHDISENERLFKYIYDNDYFECSPNIVKLFALLIANKMNIADRVDSAYLTSIYELDLAPLINVFESNINHYIKSVAFSRTDNTNEDGKILLYLLNKKDVDLEIKQQFFSNYEFCVDDINDIKNIELWPLALKHNSIKPNWDNLIAFYDCYEDKFNILVDFINRPENHFKLAPWDFSSEKSDESDYEGVQEDFARKLIESSDLSDGAYNHIIPLINTEYTDINIDTLSEAKIEVLIKSSCFGYSEIHVLSLKDHSKHRVAFLIDNIEVFITDLDEHSFDHYEFEDNEYLNLLKDRALSEEQFELLVNNIDFDLLVPDTIKEVSNLILGYSKVDENSGYSISTLSLEFDVIYSLINCSHDLNSSLEIVMQNTEYFSISEIRSLLKLFSPPFEHLSEINGSGSSKPILKINETSTKLLGLLRNKGVIGVFKKRGGILNTALGRSEYIVNLKGK